MAMVGHRPSFSKPTGLSLPIWKRCIRRMQMNGRESIPGSRTPLLRMMSSESTTFSSLYANQLATSSQQTNKSTEEPGAPRKIQQLEWMLGVQQNSSACHSPPGHKGIGCSKSLNAWVDGLSATTVCQHLHCGRLINLIPTPRDIRPL